MGRNNIAFIIIGLLTLTIGIAIKLFVGRRRFYRRNQAGLEGFRNYHNALTIPFIERIITIIGHLLIIGGVLCLIAAVFIGE